MNRKPCVVLLANLIAALPLLANAQDPRIVQRQAAGAKEPRIEIVRVKRTDSAAPEFQFRLCSPAAICSGVPDANAGDD